MAEMNQRKIQHINLDWPSVRVLASKEHERQDGGFLPGVGEEGFLEEVAFKLGLEAWSGSDRHHTQAAP